MSLADAVVYAVGEAVSYAAGRVLGRSFNLDPKRAQRIGEIVVVAVLAIALIALTVIYS